MNIEPKKLSVIRILQILWKYSDCDNALTQERIVELLENKYGIVLERRAVGRNISMLRECGFEIETNRYGCYLSERVLEDAELRMVIDCVLSGKFLTAEQSKEVIDGLCKLSNENFKKSVKNIFSVDERDKTLNSEVFLNIEIIDEAVKHGKKVKFDYNNFGMDKKLHKTVEHTVSPYQRVFTNQRYYLIAFDERHGNMGHYRIDKITNASVVNECATDLRTVDGYNKGLNYRDIANALPYMYTDAPQRVVFYVQERIVDQIVDWFGYDVKFEKVNGKIKVTARSSLKAMEHWALQYLNSVEVLEPTELREKIIRYLQYALEDYGVKAE